ncbi:Serine/threonine-protein kinase RIO1 [Dinochytrium kinnereticum]|nr:Serine/threonine-protein kinase RIO1 [Dinochytrium kinnereticum]
MSASKASNPIDGQFSDAEEDVPVAETKPKRSVHPNAPKTNASSAAGSSKLAALETGMDFPPLPINPSFVPKFNRTIALSDPGTPTEPSSPGESNTDGGGADADGEGGEDGTASDEGFDDYDDDFDDLEGDRDLDLNYGDQWFEAGSDFTKQFNKLRNQSTINNTSSTSKPTDSAEHHTTNSTTAVRPLLARKQPKSAEQPKSKADAELALMEALSAKFASRIRLDGGGEGMRLSSSVTSDVKMSSRKAEGVDKHVHKDKADRATVEQVLDPRTRIILFKMLNRNIIFEINGCISTGKEANVYHATTDDGQHRAIKIYKTSILTFKDRDRYVTGEFRFRHGYAKSNPRKMVKLWAEKEMRNLKRLQLAGIPCPDPLLLRMHVLLMTFLGDKGGWASPRLKDAAITDPVVFRTLYIHLIKMMWKMYHKCKLVHADLSEYNLLYHQKTLYVIDVSQSVEHDHPHALEFLRKDCSNVVDYFGKRCDTSIMNLRDLFDFIVTDFAAIKSAVKLEDEDEALDAYVTLLHNSIDARPEGYGENAEAMVEAAVFQSAFIPRTLDEVLDAERDIAKSRKGEASAVDLYGKVIGLVAGPESGLADEEESSEAGESDGSGSGGDNEEGSDDDDDDEEDEDGVDENGEGLEGGERRSKQKKDEDKEAKKARKAATKEEKREKRKNKMPKAVKKRKQKVASERAKGKKK